MTRATLLECVPDEIVTIIIEYVAFVVTPVVFSHDDDWIDSLIYHVDDYEYYGWGRIKERVYQAYSHQPEAVDRATLMRSIYCDFVVGTRRDKLIRGRISLKTGNKRWLLAMLGELDPLDEVDQHIIQKLPSKYAQLVYDKKQIDNCGLQCIELYCREFL